MPRVRGRESIWRTGGLLLCLVILLIGVLEVAVLAAPSDFTAAVAAIPEDGNYQERSEAVATAEALYEALGTAERAEADVVAARSRLDAVQQSLAAFRTRADAFLALADSLADATSLTDELTIVERALSDEVRVEDESYPRVGETLRLLQTRYAELVALEEDCRAFIAAVYDAGDANNTYRQTRQYLDTAADLRSRVDTRYPGVQDAISTYNTLSDQLLLIEQTNDTYLDKIRLMQQAESYELIKQYYDEAIRLKRGVTVTDYDGIAEAETALTQTRQRLAALNLAASQFIQQVQQLSGTTATFAQLREALVSYGTVDPTVDGVSDAYRTLSSRIRTYNLAVRAANAAMQAEHDRIV